MSLKTIMSLIATSAFLACSAPAFSHEPDKNPGKAQHGGQYVEYEQHHGVEMIADTNKLTFHMTEHLKPHDMTGSAFKVFIQTKTGMKTIAANPDGAKLVVDLEGALSKDVKIVLTGKDADDQTIQARFVTK